uniref:Uncharacterized protein n=1 Tax=Anguilla anguilla TaxID=7936 RepID=A0A0E9P987_ANGAN
MRRSLHDFMKELDSWETDIKKKDEQLRGGGAGEPQQVNKKLQHLLNFRPLYNGIITGLFIFYYSLLS